jgi:putative endonuclease
MWIVYILFSESANKFYIGYTRDIDNRLRQHNSGGSRSTKSAIPWIVKYTEHYESKSQAVKRESEIKKKKKSHIY